MNNTKSNTRRNFIRRSSVGLGAGFLGLSNPFIQTFDADAQNKKLPGKSPGNICVVGIDLKGSVLHDSTTESRINGILERMDDVAGLQPDIICLPELFSTMGVREQKPLKEIAEDEKSPGPVTSRIAAFAKKHSCYVVCPLITKKEGNFFNSSLLIDRNGNIAGVYNKTHPVKTEIFPDQDFKGGGVVPGAIDQTIIETDFGKVGMQICYDANWADGWENLKKKGADIVLFPSAFPGGRMLNYYALKNNYYIVSGTGGDARVIDTSGNDLDVTSEFVRYAWATINLNKVNVCTWPTNGQLPGLFKKYGDRLRIKVWGNTDVITIESLDPNLKVLNVLKEFEIPSYADYLNYETGVQDKYRQKL